jgi:hypothetical protein
VIGDAEAIWNEARSRGLAKWRKGQLEHGGDLTRKPVLEEAIAEAVDQMAYLLVLKRQVTFARLLLADALATGSRDSVQQAANLLEFGNPEGAA